MERQQLNLFDLVPEQIEAVGDRQFSKAPPQRRRRRQKLKPITFGLPEYGPYLAVHQRIKQAEELRIQHYQ
jgi:hypothetical protein